MTAVELNTCFDDKEDDDSALACRMDFLGAIYVVLQRLPAMKSKFPTHVSCLAELDQFKVAVGLLDLNHTAPDVVPPKFKFDDLFRCTPFRHHITVLFDCAHLCTCFAGAVGVGWRGGFSFLFVATVPCVCGEPCLVGGPSRKSHVLTGPCAHSCPICNSNTVVCVCVFGGRCRVWARLPKSSCARLIVPVEGAEPHEDGSAVADDFFVQLFRKLLSYIGLIEPHEGLDYGPAPYRLGSVLDRLYNDTGLRRGVCLSAVEPRRD